MMKHSHLTLFAPSLSASLMPLHYLTSLLYCQNKCPLQYKNSYFCHGLEKFFCSVIVPYEEKKFMANVVHVYSFHKVHLYGILYQYLLFYNNHKVVAHFLMNSNVIKK